MGVDVEMKKELGPFIPKPIREAKQIEKIVIPDVDDNLNYVFEAIRLSKKMIDNSASYRFCWVSGPYFGIWFKAKFKKLRYCRIFLFHSQRLHTCY